MDGASNVKTLIDRFELMAHANTAPAAPRSWSVTRSMRVELPPQPKSDNSPVKDIINRMNTQRARTQSEPVQMIQKTAEPLVVAEPAEEEPQKETPTPTQDSPTTLVVYKDLTVKTLRDNNEDEDTSFNPYEDESDGGSTITAKSTCYESDADSTITTKSTCYESDADSMTKKSNSYSIIPPSPSSFSTASTGSLDSLLSSLDLFLPDLLQASSETSAKTSKLVKRTVYRSRRSSLPENLQSTKASKLAPPNSYRRASLTGKPSASTTKDTIPAAPKSRRSSLHASKNQPPVAPTSARPRRSSLSATMAPPSAKSTRRFSESARGAPPVVASPRARGRSSSTSVPRYMDYDSSPRFAATKARNLERRRQLEERNRNLSVDKTKHLRWPRTPEWEGRLDQVRSRLFDSKEDNQSHVAKAKATTSRRHSTSTRARV